jgi:hypothetical protein
LVVFLRCSQRMLAGSQEVSTLPPALGPQARTTLGGEGDLSGSDVEVVGVADAGDVEQRQ